MKQNVALNFDGKQLPLDRRFADRQPWILDAGAEQISIRPIRIEQALERIPDPVWIKARIGESEIFAKLSHDNLTLLCNRREPGLDWRGVNAQIKPLVLECLLQHALGRLEEICGCEIEVTDILESAPAGFATNFACEVEVDGVVLAAALLLPTAQRDSLQRWQGALPPVIPASLAVSMVVRRGVATLSGMELKSLRAGDAIVLEVSGEAARHWVVTGERFLAEAAQQENGFRLITPLLSFPPSSMRHLMATSGEQDHSFFPREGAVNDIPIKLVFDAGRIEVPLSELEGLGAGHVFDIGRHPSNSVEIVAQGRIIGRGEIIVVEGLTAVRVTALNP